LFRLHHAGASRDLHSFPTRRSSDLLLALLFIPLLFALPRLYPWARPLGDVPDKNLRQHLQNITHSYLNVHGFIIRAIIYFAIWGDRKSTRLNSSHVAISYAVFCLKK